MSQETIIAHRLGIAKTALKAIRDYKPDPWDSDCDQISDLKYKAEQALKDIQRIPGKNSIVQP